MNLEQRSARKLNSQVPRTRDARLWWQCVCAVVLGIFMVGGFAAAAQQRFAAHVFSQKNVELQREIERLRAERQQLLARREAALSPQQLKKLALRIGMQTPSANQIDAFGTADDAADSNQAIESSALKAR